MSTMRAARIALAVIAVAVALALPELVSRATTFRAASFMILVLFSGAFYLVAGTGGMISLGQAAFYGLGAYFGGLLLKSGWPIYTALLAGAAVAAGAALVMGFISLRASGIYFAMLTLSLAQVAYLVVYRLPVFGGENGLPGIRVTPLRLGGLEFPIGRPDTFYYVVLVVVVASFWLLWLLTRSSFGHLLRSLREDAVRTSALGIDVRGCQLVAFVIAGALTGVAGGLAGALEGIVTPETLLWTSSALPLIVVLLGGIESFWAPVLGAAAFELLRLFTRNTRASELWIGAVLLVVVLAFPDGLMGLVHRVSAITRRVGRAPAREETA